VGGEGDMIAEDEEMVVDERLFKSDCTRGIAGKLRIVQGLASLRPVRWIAIMRSSRMCRRVITAA
jgi:hypothetical protein